jgi:hypothetical protein
VASQKEKIKVLKLEAVNKKPPYAQDEYNSIREDVEKKVA